MSKCFHPEDGYCENCVKQQQLTQEEDDEGQSMSKLSDLEEELAVQAGRLLEAKLELDRNARRVKRLEAEFREVERKIRDEQGEK